MLRPAHSALLAFSLGAAITAAASAAGEIPAQAPKAVASSASADVRQVVADTERFFREQTAAIARQLDRAARSDDHDRVELLRTSFNELARRRTEAVASLNARFGAEQVEMARASVAAALRAEAESRVAERPSWSEERDDRDQRPWSSGLVGAAARPPGGGLAHREIRLGSIGAGRSPSEIRASPNGGNRTVVRKSAPPRPNRAAAKKPAASDARSSNNRSKSSSSPSRSTSSKSSSRSTPARR